MPENKDNSQKTNSPTSSRRVEFFNLKRCLSNGNLLFENSTSGKKVVLHEDAFLVRRES